MSNTKSKRAPSAKSARAPSKVGAQKPVDDVATERTHRQRFDQLLDDVVFGKPTKR